MIGIGAGLPLRLGLIGILLLIVACGRDWRILQAIEAELRCGMTRPTVSAIASRYGASLQEGPSNPWGSWYIQVDDGYDNLALDFQEGKLSAVSATRHTGIKRVCGYLQLNLCTRERRIPLNVDYDPLLEGRELLVDGKPQGPLRNGAPFFMISEGPHMLTARGERGVESEQVFQIDIPSGCQEEFTTVFLTPSAEPDTTQVTVGQGGDRDRARTIAREINKILVNHSIISAGRVEASFSPNGALTSCNVQLRNVEFAPHSAEAISLRNEICAAIRGLGKPHPPRDLRFSMAFSLPMTD